MQRFAEAFHHMVLLAGHWPGQRHASHRQKIERCALLQKRQFLHVAPVPVILLNPQLTARAAAPARAAKRSR
ncbi:hypothetical protein [Burkholderia sp. RF2-non_BP3]|uniref:hypothetical protein n=1 Tax=Burkholderia sp. RF2-non_BP3 TaxID=1637844 RepID=UPI0012E36A4E|nr:hypothetical protein [Burkholderia sp. RF2-non_BP3]